MYRNNKIKHILFGIIFLYVILCTGCINFFPVTRHGEIKYSRDVILKIVTGNALLNISGQVGENLYHAYLNNSDENYKRIEKPYENIASPEGKITRNETIILSDGQEYALTLEAAELVLITVHSIDGNDVEIITYGSGRYGNEKKYTLKGNNKLGLTIGFRN